MTACIVWGRKCVCGCVHGEWTIDNNLSWAQVWDGRDSDCVNTVSGGRTIFKVYVSSIMGRTGLTASLMVSIEIWRLLREKEKDVETCCLRHCESIVHVLSHSESNNNSWNNMIELAELSILWNWIFFRDVFHLHYICILFSHPFSL